MSTEALLFLVSILFFNPVVTLPTAENPRFEDIERVAYNRTVDDGLAYIDSLASCDTLDEYVANGLRARIMNRPGLWDTWGEQAGKAFEIALTSYNDFDLSTSIDSLSFCSLLLDYAYFSARAGYADTLHTDIHRKTEFWALNEALRVAVSDWQRERASMELARYYSRDAQSDSLIYSYFEGVVARSGNSDVLGPAYWHWNDWLIAQGRMDSAQETLHTMKDVLNGTKWDSRARDFMILVKRNELFVESVEVVDSSLQIISSLRNVAGEVKLSVYPASQEIWVRECGMGQAYGYRTPSGGVHYTEVISADIDGEILTWSVPVPVPGLYELELACRDTSITYSLGVFNFLPSLSRGTSCTFIGDVPDDDAVFASVMRPDGEWVPVTDITWEDTIVRIPVGAEELIQVLITGKRGTGWCGSTGAGPTFQVIVDWHGG